MTDPLSPARVEAMAREYCRIKGLDAGKRYERQAREFIAMQLAYERTKG